MPNPNIDKSEFINGMRIVKKGRKFEIIDSARNIFTVPVKYDDIQYYKDDLYVLRQYGNPEYDRAWYAERRDSRTYYGTVYKYVQVVDKSGKVMIPQIRTIVFCKRGFLYFIHVENKQAVYQLAIKRGDQFFFSTLSFKFV